MLRQFDAHRLSQTIYSLQFSLLEKTIRNLASSSRFRAFQLNCLIESIRFGKAEHKENLMRSQGKVTEKTENHNENTD